ncbi:MAG: hypothetical protein AAB627_01725 [Patescibacteria group bacterium]
MTPKLKIRKNNKKKRGRKRSRKKVKGVSKVYYGLNSKFEFLNDLRKLILASPSASFTKITKKILALGRVKLALVSGVFLNKENVADLMIVGDDIDRRKFKNFLKSLEAEMGTQIVYAIMDTEEFHYRRAMFDRFVRLMLEGPHEVLIEKIEI